MLIGAATVLVWHGSGPRPPYYNGKSLSELIDESGYPHSDYLELVRAVGVLEGEAVPYLLHVLENEPTFFQRTYTKLHSNCPPVIQNRLPYPPSRSRRSRAAAQLRNAGSNAVSAIPVLVRISREDSDWATRANALSSLEKLAPGSEYCDMALAAMIAATRDIDPGVRQGAFGRLGAFTNRLEEVIPALLRGLDHPILMHSSASSLRRLGPRGIEAAREKIKAGGIPIYYVPEIERILWRPQAVEEPLQAPAIAGLETLF